MKVLHIINNLGSGGAESMLVNFLKYSKDKADIDLLLIVDDKIVYNLPENITIFTLQPKGKRYSLKKLYLLYKFIKKRNYDIVHAHLFPSQYYLALVKIFLPKKIKLVTTEHNTTNNRRRFFITKIIDYLLYSFYDHIVFISEGVKKQFEEDFNYKRFRGSVINNGISLENFKSKTIKNKKDRIKLLMVASFSKQKDHVTLIKAFSLLDNKYELSLVGEGEKMGEIINYVEELNLSERVHFLGFQKTISEIYAEHDIFILSSNWEGFGLVTVEAMASGLPVIASDVEGLKEVVEGAGLLFEAGNKEDLALQINIISNNKELRENLIKKGLVRANMYDVKKLVIDTLHLYKNIIK